MILTSNMEDSRANAILRMLIDASSQASKLRSEVAAMRGDAKVLRGAGGLKPAAIMSSCASHHSPSSQSAAVVHAAHACMQGPAHSAERQLLEPYTPVRIVTP